MEEISRVVPARELSLEEVRMINKKLVGINNLLIRSMPFLSSMIGGRGDICLADCRILYYLSPKDICTLDLIPELAVIVQGS